MMMMFLRGGRPGRAKLCGVLMLLGRGRPGLMRARLHVLMLSRFGAVFEHLSLQNQRRYPNRLDHRKAQRSYQAGEQRRQHCFPDHETVTKRL